MFITSKKSALDCGANRSSRIDYLFKIVSRYHLTGESVLASLKRGSGRGLTP